MRGMEAGKQAPVLGSVGAYSSRVLVLGSRLSALGSLYTNASTSTSARSRADPIAKYLASGW
jgi:hypothetical protein